MVYDDGVVLLGCPSKASCTEVITAYCSRLGGEPVWIKKNNADDDDTVFSDIQCKVCQEKQMCFVAQVYAPIDSLERVLFIFGCNTLKCSKSSLGWKVMRLQHPRGLFVDSTTTRPTTNDSTTTTTLSTKELVSALSWSDDSEDDEENIAPPPSSSNIEDLLTKRDSALLSTKGKSSTNGITTSNSSSEKKTQVEYKHYTLLKSFESITLDIVEEPYEDTCSKKEDRYAMKLYADYLKSEEEENIITDNKNKSSSTTTGGDTNYSTEKYERVPSDVKVFQKFQKRISRLPSQVLRYDYGGKPLAISLERKSTAASSSSCSGCGAVRVFEMQLMPAVNFLLDVEDYSSEEGMDWGTIDIYSCPNSCTQSSTEEVIVMQSVDS